jgi:hypothetical protein
MSIQRIIDWSILKTTGSMTGVIASPFYQYSGADGGWTWACDVDIGQEEVLRNVPVATNNRDILYATQGMPVVLTRQGNNRLAITGLSKKLIGNMTIFEVTFDDDLISVADPVEQGYHIRLLTYEELDTYGGYGVVPYGAKGRFLADGSLDYIIRSY